MKAQTKQPYLPYMGLEFHLAESVRLHREKPDVADHHFVASGMYQEAQFEKDLDLKQRKIQKYKKYCKDKGIKTFSLTNKKVGV